MWIVMKLIPLGSLPAGRKKMKWAVCDWCVLQCRAHLLKGCVFSECVLMPSREIPLSTPFSSMWGRGGDQRIFSWAGSLLTKNWTPCCFVAPFLPKINTTTLTARSTITWLPFRDLNPILILLVTSLFACYFPSTLSPQHFVHILLKFSYYVVLWWRTAERRCSESFSPVCCYI